MTTEIIHAETDEQIAATFDVVLQLRPHLERSNYVAMIRRLMASDGLKVLALLDEGEVRAVAAYRVMHMLYCESLIYIDDLVVDERVRSHGYGARLISRLKDEGRALGCSEVQLISRVTREHAHRFYFREGFGMECFHFRAKLS
ncbi:GNAT family N-acetyltransferase [Pinirhizobacter soli]|uniref:GNAT family N-acetyltransferase n=1 Tax=Pinirhizobacter soli TaxID=2786953 RepID=UPI00202A9E1A|nr:GNAT family N-acetyltransferase [Pinirhizobacter soli]